MNNTCCARTIALAAALACAAGPSSGAMLMIPTHLTCEFRTNPFGIDTRQPRLGWILESETRGAAQSAFRILVSSTPALLAADRGDMWDSGKRPGGRTSSVRYEGAPLRSHQPCYWKVMTWNGETPGPWSAPASWSMGILSADEWKAEWIGYDKPRHGERPGAFSTARWIWHAADKPFNAPAGKRYFVHTLTITGTVNEADLAVSADDTYTLFINGRRAAGSPDGADSWKTPQRLDVSTLLQTGDNVLYVEAENLTPGPAGFLFWLRLLFTGGNSEILVSDRSWLSSETPVPHWKTEGARSGEGTPADALGNVGMPPWCVLDGSMLVLPPPRHLGTTLTVRKPVARAVLYATALGLCDVYLNGRRVSEDSFTPGWTDYARRVYYRSYDVTSLLKVGENTWGAVLADGWYSGHVGWGLQRDHYGSRTRFRAQLHLEYADGSREEAGTGAHWRGSTGPTREADFLMGELFDARLDTGPCGLGPDAGPVDVGTEDRPVLEAHPGPPVRVFEELVPKSITALGGGAWVIDMGQNFAGVVRLRLRGEAGRTVRLRFAERLNPDGTLYTANLRGARAIDTYICKGEGEEIWAPRFTFHGFQYVEVSGLGEAPTEETVTGLALSSATPHVGSFACSDPIVNTLARNVLWTQRANFIDVPTDCPQRDERLGWTGDAQAYIRSACLNTDVQAFFHKWLVDLTDAQREDGQFPMVAPLKVADADGGPAWADAGAICPWTVYDVYGDRDILERHYEAMVRFVEFCRGRSTPDLLPPERFHCFGDWLHIQAETPHDVIFLAYFARVTHLVAASAEVLGKTADAEKYRSLAAAIAAAFRSAYVDADGHVKGRTQTAYVLALASGVLEEEGIVQAARHLVEDITSRGWRLSTGFVGTKDLMLVLSAIGRNDVAYRLLQSEEFPSWGFTIRHGATSIWERWDGWTPEKGFQDPGMNSFAHYAFGAVYQWMVENIGGIRNEAPGYTRLVIAPHPGGTISWAKVGFIAPTGPVSVDWHIAGERMTVKIAIPANVSATIHLPGVRGEVLESGGIAARQPGLTRVSEGVFAAGSGSYEFSYPYGVSGTESTKSGR